MYVVKLCFRFTLLANFHFHLCLRFNFHTSSFWVLILAAGGPYWVLISQKNGSLLGPYLKAWGSLLVLEAVRCYNIPVAKAWQRGIFPKEQRKHFVEGEMKNGEGKEDFFCEEE